MIFVCFETVFKGKEVWTLEIKGNNIHEKIRYLEEILK